MKDTLLKAAGALTGSCLVIIVACVYYLDGRSVGYVSGYKDGLAKARSTVKESIEKDSKKRKETCKI